MKKLMFAAMAVAAGTLLADVASQNVVGYNSMEADADATIYRVFSFDKVGGDNTFKLGQISFGDQDFAWWNGDCLATINEFGGQDTYYTWNDENGGFWCVSDEACTPTDEDAMDVEFEPNTGFIFYSLNGVSLNIPSPIPAK